MKRAIFLLLSLLCLSGCESPGGHSLAAFGPNTVPPPVRQPGTDPYYTASSAAPNQAAPTPLATASAPTATPSPNSGESTGTAIPSTAKATESIPTTLSAAARPSNEPPIRIMERSGALPSSSNPPAETSRLPSTSGGSPSPLLRSSTTPKLQPIPSSAFGRKTTQSGQVAPASYEQPAGISQTSSADSNWRRR